MRGVMLITLLAGCVVSNYSTQGATHKGVSLDHSEYTAKARCVTSDETFDKVSVKFKKDRVNVYFDDGGHLTLKLESEEIADLHHIVAHVTDKGHASVTWILDLSDWKEDGSTPDEEPR